MNANNPTLAGALHVAVATVAASSLVTVAPPGSWSSFGAPLLLVGALVGADFADRSGDLPRRSALSPATLIVATAIFVASAMVGARDPHRLAQMIPIFGACAAVPLLLHSRASKPRNPFSRRELP